MQSSPKVICSLSNNETLCPVAIFIAVFIFNIPNSTNLQLKYWLTTRFWRQTILLVKVGILHSRSWQKVINFFCTKKNQLKHWICIQVLYNFTFTTRNCFWLINYSFPHELCIIHFCFLFIRCCPTTSI